MNVLITGGAGFIASHIADSLLERGDTVTALDCLHPQVHGNSEQVPSYLNDQVKFIKGDVRDRDLLKKSLEGVDAVIYNAAAVGVGQSMYEIENYVDINCRGSAVFWEELLNFKDDIKKIIIASSMSAYGEGSYVDQDNNKYAPPIRTNEQLLNKDWDLNVAGKTLSPIPTAEDKPMQPTSIYAITKRDQEEMFLSLGAAYDIPVVAFRYFNVIGSRQALSNPYTGVAAIFCSRILNNNPPLLFEDGMMQRDFVHVKDVAQANLLALDNDDIVNDVFNIGSGSPISIKDLAIKILKVMGSDLEPEIVGKYRVGDIRHCYADISKAKEILTYQPSYDIDRSVEEVTAWVESQIAEDKVDSSYAELDSKKLIK